MFFDIVLKLCLTELKLKSNLIWKVFVCMYQVKGGGHCFCCALQLDIDIISTGIFIESS